MRCVVDAHAVPLFKPVLSNIELAAILGGERGGFSVILLVENPCEEVILELHGRVLEEC